MQQKNLKTNGAYTESTDMIFKTCNKNYSSRATIPFKKKKEKSGIPF